MSSYLGQNFLKDTKTKQYIKEKTTKLYQGGNFDTIIEIGPGKGAITKYLIDIPQNYIMIEKDETMQSHLEKFILQAPNHTQLIFEDVLKVDIDTLLNTYNIDPKKCLVIGNLPYYITSPILRKFFGTGKQDFLAGLFMIQKEVGEKVKTDAIKKSYLRWLLNYGYNVTYLKSISPKSFSPAPKVTSCLIQLTSKNINNFLSPGMQGRVGKLNEAILETKQHSFSFKNFVDFLDQYAPFSRKTLGKIQKIVEKNSCTKESEFLIEIPEDLKSKRLEELGWGDVKEILG